MAYKVRSQEEVKVLFDYMAQELHDWASLRNRSKNPVVKTLAGKVLEILLEINDKINMALEWVGEEE